MTAKVIPMISVTIENGKNFKKNKEKVDKMRERKCVQCEFCGKILLAKQAMKAHEEICFRNPKRRACAVCAYPFYRLGTETNPDPEISVRMCKKGHNIEKSLRADCIDFLWFITAGHSNFYSEYYPGVLEKKILRLTK